jgi:acetyl-CoA carboxylase carboxyltransferase component
VLAQSEALRRAYGVKPLLPHLLDGDGFEELHAKWARTW